MLGLCAIWSPRAAAQNRSLPQVTIRMDRVPMSQIMSEIERQTKYLFVTGSDVKTDRITSLDVTAVPLTEALNRMVAGADLTYDIRSLSIILSVKKAEQPAAVAGYVRDGSGQPVIGATIIVRDTSTGTTTDADGRFTLSVPAPSTAWLEVSYLGYEPQAVAVGNRTSFDITLREAASEIESVVVTALGIKRSEKALSYNAQQINAEDIVAVKDVNFVNSLNGKVAGLNINASSSGVGGSSKVVMRGSKSIEQSSNALYVIDGIPMCNFRSDGSEEFDSQGSSEAIADLNPEDIESMTVLSGAAAAALYGSDAANGAILITTKRGKAGQTTVTVTSNTEVLAPFVMPMFQTRYGTGDKLAGAANGIYSWGERLNAFNYRGYDPADDYFQTGVVGTETVSFSTGNERSQTYASAGAVNSRGIIPNNGYDRYNFTFRNTSSFLKDKMHLDLGASYIIQKDRNMVNQGVYSNPLVSAYLFPRADLRRDSNGDIYQDMDGNIFVDNKTQTKDFIKLGSVFPDANLAWRNDFRWRNFNFGFLLTARLGGVVYSRTQAVMDYYGVSASSADARDAGGIVINGNDLIDAQKWYQTVANGDTTPQYYTYSATNVRLQEASIGYTIPRKKLGDVCDITLSIVGRNLWMLYNKAPFDPEAVATTSNYYQGIDYFMMPSLRSIGFNVRVKF